MMPDEKWTNQEFPIPPEVRTVLTTLENAGFEAWLVGGCVRDYLLGSLPKDYDVTTNASADRICRVFDGFRVIETGIRHGTVTVISDGIPIEVTTYRVDGAYSDGRHPDSVRFTSDIRDDLSRRDFTVNAIAFSPARGFLDLFGGTDDLKAGIIRCVGEPDRRFGEDALRILRALRFASRLGFSIEPATAAGIHRCRDMLSKIALERITQELFGLLDGECAPEVLRQFGDVIAVILPPVRDMFGFEQHNPHHDSDVWEHTLRVIDASPAEPVLRLAALLHDVGKPRCFTRGEDGIGHFYGHAAVSADISRDIFASCLRTDKHTQERVLFLVEHHDEPLPPDRKALRKRLSKYGEEALRQLIALHRADIMGQKRPPDADKLSALDQAEEIVNELAAESACLTLKDLAVNGGDLMALGIPKGPKIGEILHLLLSEVLEEKLLNRREELMARAETLL